MGLDMYLYANKYESKSTYNYDREKRDKVSKTFYPRALNKLARKHADNNFLSKETFYQIGYWRKFNALHGFIVEHYAEGVDECQKIYLSKDDIKEILNTLKEVKANPNNAMDIMPPTSGFFFGSQDIDEWFIKDVEYSIELFEDVLEMLEKNDKRNNYYEIYYQASW